MPSAAATEVATALQLTDDESVSALQSLEQHALASRAELGAESRWTAVPPLLTGQRLLVERARKLLDAQQELLTLAESHQRTARAGGAENLVEIVLGEHAVHAQVSRLLETTTEEILALVKPPFVAVRGEEAADAATKRARVIYDQSVFVEDDDVSDMIRRPATPDVQLRVHPAVPMRLQIHDRRVAAMPLVRHDAQPAILLVHTSGLLTLAVEFFELLWNQAIPLPIFDEHSAADGVPDIEDRRVLGLLLGGLTDESIAHQMDRSLRWVQRRVRLLMDEAGVRTRLQLGWEAHRRGWLDDAPAAQPPVAGVSSDSEAPPPTP